MNSNDAAFVGGIPEHYDRGLGPMIFVDYAADIARRAVAGNPRRVLETAAGTGIVTRALRDALPAATHLTATDLNPPMLDIARTKFRAGEQIELKAADAMALPFADATFDAVVCQFGVMFYPDKGKSYREVHRVLLPGGRYLFNVWDSHAYNPFARIGYEVGASFFPADPPQFYKVPFSSAAIDPIKESLLAAGFVDIHVAVVGIEKQIPEAAAFARGMIYGNPLIEEIRAKGGDPERVVDKVVETLRREFGDNPGRMPLQAMVYSAKKPGDRV